MTEESHRDAMNDAIRAQRERANVPRTMLPPEGEPVPTPPPVAEPAPVVEPVVEPIAEPEPVAKQGLLARLLGR